MGCLTAFTNVALVLRGRKLDMGRARGVGDAGEGTLLDAMPALGRVCNLGRKERELALVILAGAEVECSCSAGDGGSCLSLVAACMDADI